VLFVQDPRPPPPYFHTTQFDIGTEPQHTTMGYFALMKILRTRVYVTELKAVSGDYDYDAYDSQSRHILGLSEFQSCAHPLLSPRSSIITFVSVVTTALRAVLQLEMPLLLMPAGEPYPLLQSTRLRLAQRQTAGQFS
jgi:hypothetical protein